MVKIKESSHINPDGSINLEAWLQHAAHERPAQEISLIRHACILSQITGENKPAPTGVSCLQQGLTMAEILLDLQLDKETIAAALVYSNAHYAELSLEDIKDHLGEIVCNLVQGTIQMDAIHKLPNLTSQAPSQVENIRKMLLAMAEDMRVVLIKLAERTAIMRSLKVFEEKKARLFAQETLDIYAPLANRLGLEQLKWELEDLSLYHLEPAAYHEIAKLLHERRIDRENYIQAVINQLQTALNKAEIKNFEINGRAKHIYSIYRKMLRKKLSYEQLYDLNAVRILVPTLEDCYTALSITHGLWQSIPKEFDDYIATPKSNGYRSIHTAIIGPANKNVEVQIRTYQMHKESEHGIAAHWRYKEGGAQKADYEAKIAWLRQVLAWQKELVKSGSTSEHTQPITLDDRVYVFTPAGQIVDLPQGATPLDFAYQIHSEIGHRCRGAKVNGAIVPLTHKLTTGERIEILTAKQPNPSRDWINTHLGYLTTARAKAKVHHWFKLQDYDKNVAEGQALLDRECQRLHLGEIDQEKLAQKLHFKNKKDMFAALGSGELRWVQIYNSLQSQQEVVTKTENITPVIPLRAPTKNRPKGINIAGIGNLLTHTALCCKPAAGDSAIGFITQGRGVAIHRSDCPNILHLMPEQHNRLVEIDWGTGENTLYPIDLFIEAYDRPGLVRDISTLVANERLNLVAVTTTTDKMENKAHIKLTIEIPSIELLSKLFDRIKHVPNVIDVLRQTAGK